MFYGGYLLIKFRENSKKLEKTYKNSQNSHKFGEMQGKFMVKIINFVIQN
jgi:hypothetical protein